MPSPAGSAGSLTITKMSPAAPPSTTNWLRTAENGAPTELRVTEKKIGASLLGSCLEAPGGGRSGPTSITRACTLPGLMETSVDQLVFVPTHSSASRSSSMGASGGGDGASASTGL